MSVFFCTAVSQCLCCRVTCCFKIFIRLFPTMQISSPALVCLQNLFNPTSSAHIPHWEFKATSIWRWTGECDYTLVSLWLDTTPTAPTSPLCLTPNCLSYLLCAASLLISAIYSQHLPKDLWLLELALPVMTGWREQYDLSQRMEAVQARRIPNTEAQKDR